MGQALGAERGSPCRAALSGMAWLDVSSLWGLQRPHTAPFHAGAWVQELWPKVGIGKEEGSGVRAGGEPIIVGLSGSDGGGKRYPPCVPWCPWGPLVETRCPWEARLGVWEGLHGRSWGQWSKS